MDILMKSNTRISIVGAIKNALSSHVELQLKLPADIYYRAELICSYISREDKFKEFNLNTLLMLLYQEFVSLAITNCNLKNIDRMVSPIYKEENLTLVIDGETHTVNKTQHEFVYLNIRVHKKDYNELSLITREIRSVFGHYLSVEMILSNLLINAIEDYKNGINKKLYINIKKRLRELF